MDDIDRFAVAAFVLFALVTSYLVVVVSLSGTTLLFATGVYLVTAIALLYRVVFGGQN